MLDCRSASGDSRSFGKVWSGMMQLVKKKQFVFGGISSKKSRNGYFYGGFPQYFSLRRVWWDHRNLRICWFLLAVKKLYSKKMVAWRNKQEKQCGPPPVINCFISPINYSCTINHTYWSYKPSKLSRGPTLKGKKSRFTSWKSMKIRIHDDRRNYGIHTLSLATLLWKPGHQMNYPYHPLPMIPRFIEKCPLVLKPRKSFQYTHWESHEEHSCPSTWSTWGHYGKIFSRSFKSFNLHFILYFKRLWLNSRFLQPVGSSSSSQVWYIWCSYDSIRYTSYIIHPWNTICQSCLNARSLVPLFFLLLPHV